MESCTNEQLLWRAVIKRALCDACINIPPHDANAVLRWCKTESFSAICTLADVPEQSVKKAAISIANGGVERERVVNLIYMVEDATSRRYSRKKRPARWVPKERRN